MYCPTACWLLAQLCALQGSRKHVRHGNVKVACTRTRIDNFLRRCAAEGKAVLMGMLALAWNVVGSAQVDVNSNPSADSFCGHEPKRSLRHCMPPDSRTCPVVERSYHVGQRSECAQADELRATGFLVSAFSVSTVCVSAFSLPCSIPATTSQSLSSLVKFWGSHIRAHSSHDCIAS